MKKVWSGRRIVYLARIGNDSAVTQAADELYDNLQESGVSVLYDDRDVRPGDMFADADLLGLPHRVVISQKTLESQSAELKKRTSSETENILLNQVAQRLTK
jgi:prolyl-tRNA synthetase